MRLLPLALLLAVALPATAVVQSHLDHRAVGEAAYARKDYPAAREAFAAALELRPDSPRYLRNLAGLAALNGDTKAALDYLDRLAALGVAPSIARDPDFASLQGSAEFFAILRWLEENRAPRGEASTFAELPGRVGIIEGLAFRPRTGDLFLSDVHQRCIWKRDRLGQVTRFTSPDDELFGIFGIAIDERRNTLWAAMAAVPEMSGFTPELKGQAALAEFNLGTSELRRVIPVPGDGRDHALGDLTVGSDGTVYATDNASPVIWQFVPGEEEITKLVDSPDFVSLQGIVANGRDLIVSDYANGLFVIRLPAATIHALAPPPNTTLIGLDGLAATPGGLVAVQNGVEPQRLIHLAMSPDLTSIRSSTVLGSGLPQFTDLTLTTITDEGPLVIANSGWAGFDPAKTPVPRAHTVHVFQSTLPVPLP